MCGCRDLLDRPRPKPEDHAKVLSKEVQLPDGTLTPLDDQDKQIVLKLSADYNLNEVECVKLLLATHQQVRSLTPPLFPRPALMTSRGWD